MVGIVGKAVYLLALSRSEDRAMWSATAPSFPEMHWVGYTPKEAVAGIVGAMEERLQDNARFARRRPKDNGLETEMAIRATGARPVAVWVRVPWVTSLKDALELVSDARVRLARQAQDGVEHALSTTSMIVFWVMVVAGMLLLVGLILHGAFSITCPDGWCRPSAH